MSTPLQSNLDRVVVSPVLPEDALLYYIYARVQLQFNHPGGDTAGPTTFDNVPTLVDSGANYMQLEVNDEALVQEFELVKGMMKESMAPVDQRTGFYDCLGWYLVPTLDIWPHSNKAASQDGPTGVNSKVDLRSRVVCISNRLTNPATAND